MTEINIFAERTITAPAPQVYDYVADMRHHRPHFLPPAFVDFHVESGGVGAGTVTRYKLTAGGRSRQYCMTVAEPEPGRVMTESDESSSLVTTTTVTPRGDAECQVRIAANWTGASGIGGVFERIFAPGVMRGIYADELERLAAYAREQSPA
jgi:uncharacterized protein YndB with AHSA1/START domain